MENFDFYETTCSLKLKNNDLIILKTNSEKYFFACLSF